MSSLPTPSILPLSPPFFLPLFPSRNSLLLPWYSSYSVSWIAVNTNMLCLSIIESLSVWMVSIQSFHFNNPHNDLFKILQSKHIRKYWVQLTLHLYLGALMRKILSFFCLKNRLILFMSFFFSAVNSLSHFLKLDTFRQKIWIIPEKDKKVFRFQNLKERFVEKLSNFKMKLVTFYN